MRLPEMTTYRDVYDRFRWDVPATFNFGRDVVDARAAKEPDRLALIWCDASGAEERYTYGEMSRLSSRFASLLRARGVGKGDRIIVMLPRLPQWQIALVGALKLGAVPIPCIDMLTERDVAYRARHSGAKAVVTTAANAAKFSGLGAPLAVRIATEDGATPLPAGWEGFGAAMAAADGRFDAVDTAADDMAILYYTSGSTGHPKGVAHAARALFAWEVSAAYWLDLGERDVMWCTADTGWSKAGTSILFGPWSRGAAVVFYNGPFEPKRRLEMLARYGVTVFCAAGTEFYRLIREDVRSHDLSALRHAVSAGEALNPVILERWQELTGIRIHEAYGQTETLMTVLNYRGTPIKIGSMGLASPGTMIAILDDQGRHVPTGATGNIAVGLPNPQVMLGYYEDPDRTAANIVRGPDGDWFITGDLGSQDEDGYVFYQGRADDVINSAGYRIGPLEVENAILEHEAVQECAVVASPDAERGEVVKAFVVLRDGAAAGETLAREIQDHVKRLTAPYKYPRRIQFLDSLPKTATGKIMRRELRDRERAAERPSR